MFFICNVYGMNSETFEEEVIRVTTERHYTAPNNGPMYSPHLKSVLNFDEQLFSRGSTSGEAKVGVGEIVIENSDAEYDRFRKFAFDGRVIEVYFLEDLLDAPTDANLFFRGTIFYVEFSFSQISIYIKNRLEILSPLIQSSTFAGTNEGGANGYEGDTTDIKGKTKPMVWGTCLNVPASPINKSMQIFGCNYDIEGNRKAVAKFFNVADKGGALMYAGDYAALGADGVVGSLYEATVASGFYATCVAEGVFKVGRVPQGDITCDVAEVLGEDSSAPRTVMRILEECYALVAGVDYDAGDLEALHQLNKTACGYYVDEEVEGLTVITDLLSSIGGWIVPDRLGIFRSGRFDLPTDLDIPVATFDDSLILMDSLQRLPTGDQGRGIPAKSFTLQHTKLWKVMAKSETLVSVSDVLREYYSLEFRSAQITNTDVALLHPLAPDLSEESLMVLLPPVKIRPFLEEDIGEAPSNWDQVDDSSVLADNMLQVNYKATWPYGPSFNVGSIAAGGNSVLENQVEELWNGKFRLSYFLESQAGAGTTNVNFFWGNIFFLFPHESLHPYGLVDSSLMHPVEGWNHYDFKYLNDSPTYSWLLVISTSSGTSILGKFSITPKVLGLTPDEEAARRLDIYSKHLERYVFDVPILEGMFVNVGEIVLMKTVGRFELTEGRKYVVIGKNVLADDDKITFDVIGADSGTIGGSIFGDGFE